ncbi:MAG: hypothetical protein QOH47_980 [Sphingomonadales bacterium]|jgi:hypothetical protein|nr:hypothetical protein [Sphingomonadales bacterium]
MLRKRRDAAHKVATGLFAVEKAINEALTRAAELNAMMPGAQLEAQLSTVVGQEAFDGAAAVFASLAKARRQVVRTHQAMDQARTQIGLRTTSFGDGTQKPPLFPAGVSNDEGVAAEAGRDIAA